MQGAVTLFPASFNEIGKANFPGLVRFFQRRPWRQVITVPVARAVTVLGRKGAIGHVRFGRVNAKTHHHQNRNRRTAKKPAHRFPRPENGRAYNCIKVVSVQSNKSRSVDFMGGRGGLFC
jgi:hypothetical protein